MTKTLSEATSDLLAAITEFCDLPADWDEAVVLHDPTFGVALTECDRCQAWTITAAVIDDDDEVRVCADCLRNLPWA